MRRHVSSLALLLCTGCFSAHPADGSSGARLEVLVWEPEDGSGAFVEGLFDRELEMTCRFTHLPDGSSRCIPTDALPLAFEDAGCTRPLLRDDCLEEGAWVSGLSWSGTFAVCGRTVAAQETSPGRVGVRVSVARVHGFDVSGECVPLEDAEGPWRRLEPVASERFVAGRQARRPVPGRDDVEVTGFEGVDGSFEPRGFWDARREDHCWTWPSAGERAPCIPRRSGHVDRGGERCARRLVSQPGCPEARVDVWYEVEHGACGPEVVDLYRRGEPVPSASVEACGIAVDDETWAEAVPLEDDAVVWFPSTATGSGRLRPFPGRAPGNLWLVRPRGLYLDTELGFECVPRRVDGVFRCLPAGAPAPLFADPGCTEPATSTRTAPAPACLGFLTISEPTACGAWSHRVMQIAEPLDQAFRRDADGSCAPLPADVDVAFHRLEPVPMERLAALRRR